MTGVCRPQMHYMVKMDSRLAKIRVFVDAGEYFSISRARQYGKTTTLHALVGYLREDYFVLGMDFQMMSYGDFESEDAFVAAFAREAVAAVSGREDMPADVEEKLRGFAEGNEGNAKLAVLFSCLSEWCRKSEKPVVLMIDEVDMASNNQVFLDFLSQLRGYFNHRLERPIFHSVILAGVYDIKNLKQKICRDSERRFNSPWNIAADFDVEMSFSPDDIEGMLAEYETDYETGMEIGRMAQLIYDYTSGYPFLVSRLCKILDETLIKGGNVASEREAWTKEGVLQAVQLLLAEKNTLFESLVNKLNDYPELKRVLYELLFTGRNVAYNPDDEATDIARMFGFVKVCGGNVVIANRIFETRLYNMFLTAEQMQGTDMYKAALQDKNQFVKNGRLDMERVLERFIVHFNSLFGDRGETFLEEDGRRYFLLYLRPIINGTGNYYIESRTRNMERTDVIVDYHGEQFVIEMKIWRGAAYNTRGERQLLDYLEHYHLDVGYMLSFNFNKNKKTGIRRVRLGEKVLIEAVV